MTPSRHAAVTSRRYPRQRRTAEGRAMVILGYATLAGVGVVWALARSPLGRAVGLSVTRFADAARAEPGSLD